MTAAPTAPLRTDGLLGLALAAWAQLPPHAADRVLVVPTPDPPLLVEQRGARQKDPHRASAGSTTGD